MALGITEAATEAQLLADDFNKVYLRSKDLYNTYWDRNIGGGLPANDGDTIGTTVLTKADFVGMITVVENFIKFMEGDTAPANTYRINCNKARAKS